MHAVQPKSNQYPNGYSTIKGYIHTYTRKKYSARFWCVYRWILWKKRSSSPTVRIKEQFQFSPTYLLTYIYTYIHTWKFLASKYGNGCAIFTTSGANARKFQVAIHTYIHTYIHTVHTHIHRYIHAYINK